jgi:hypothetical protein
MTSSSSSSCVVSLFMKTRHRRRPCKYPYTLRAAPPPPNGLSCCAASEPTDVWRNACSGRLGRPGAHDVHGGGTCTSSLDIKLPPCTACLIGQTVTPPELHVSHGHTCDRQQSDERENALVVQRKAMSPRPSMSRTKYLAHTGAPFSGKAETAICMPP